MKCISLFSGCGGMDLGLSRAGFQIVFANELEDVFCQSHRANFPRDTLVVPGSIARLDRSSLRGLLGVKLAEGIDLVAGGPPCPPYSKSRFYRKEKPRALNDPVADETMRGYLRVLEVVRPRAFMFENVAGFAYGVHRDALDSLLEATIALGYQCSWRVLNAADFGVPQNRQRFILVGMIAKEFVFPQPTHSDPADGSLFGRSIRPWVTAGEVLADLDTDENACDEGHFAGGQHHNLLVQVPPGDNYLFFTKERGHPRPVFKWRSRYWSFLLKLSPNRPAWTIQARRSNNMGPFHWRNRILRIAEVKRLQTFPDNWVICGTVEEQWRQIGNAVPPALAEVLGHAIAEQLEETAHGSLSECKVAKHERVLAVDRRRPRRSSDARVKA